MILRLDSATLHASVDADLQALETRLTVLPSTYFWGSSPLEPSKITFIAAQCPLPDFYGQENPGEVDLKNPRPAPIRAGAVRGRSGEVT